MAEKQEQKKKQQLLPQQGKQSAFLNNGAELVRKRLESMVILLSDRFQVLSEPDSHGLSLVKLSENYLYYQLKPEVNLSGANDENLKLIAINDIIGAQVLKEKKFQNNGDVGPGYTSVRLVIFAYPLKSKSKLSIGHRQLRRIRTLVVLLVNKHASLEENTEVAEKWRKTILWLISNKSHLFLSDCNIDIPDVIPQKRRLLFLINPTSGPGKALDIFQNRVVPLLNESDTTYKVVITKYSKCGTVYVREAKDLITQWDGIVVVSGDGLLFEVFNGLMQRLDWEQAIKVPVGVIPGGSGNGIAHSINYAVGEPASCNAVLSAALNIIKGKTMPMDLVRVKTSEETIYSCLSVGWGLISDIDIESERLRLVGGARFTIWAIIRAIGLRKYRGRLMYLPVPGNFERKIVKSPNILSAMLPRSNTMVEDSNESFKEVNPRVFRSVSLNACDSVESDLNPSTFQSNPIPVTICENCDLPDVNQSNLFSNSSLDLNSNSRELSPEWVTVDGDFVLVYSSYQTHISSDCFFTPGAKFDDGMIWLIYIMGTVTRPQILQFLASLDSGNHIKLPFVHSMPVRAFKLVPAANEGRITVDGELVETGPIDVEVLPSIARLMSR